ncbi:MAG: DUF1501 domain-containing protein [Verrucomicrobiota bacterium]
MHRRSFLADVGMGLTGLALVRCSLKDGVVRANPEEDWQPPTGEPHFGTESEKRHLVVHEWRCVAHGKLRSKTRTDQVRGKTISETPFKDVQNPEKLKLARVTVVNDANGQQRNKLYPLQVGFRKYGQSGIELSDWFPHIGKCVDDIAIIRSMYTTDDNHGAQLNFIPAGTCWTANIPTLGAWVHYGLGSLNDNLPQFISIGKREYWNKKDGHYLGPAHDAIPIRIDPKNPLDFGKPASGQTLEQQQIGFDLVGNLNRLTVGRVSRMIRH